ncbi:hypothetical protein PpBr36_09042 [Pyricularia pennisetigena]|uniref:hypothetical protein n=1 Tax=Pyricularia pennisetigena TaxID=1578925 RepID=UPI001154BA2E|nr:hypothetical protein PpBr36_09042 [Pyricularia pennisetigena]TLS24381.1 hypothetical protein PpBr36_09042 [Pyricularia pennisetigena]
MLTPEQITGVAFWIVAGGSLYIVSMMVVRASLICFFISIVASCIRLSTLDKFSKSPNATRNNFNAVMWSILDLWVSATCACPPVAVHPVCAQAAEPAGATRPQVRHMLPPPPPPSPRLAPPSSVAGAGCAAGRVSGVRKVSCVWGSGCSKSEDMVLLTSSNRGSSRLDDGQESEKTGGVTGVNDVCEVKSGGTDESNQVDDH